eukprot:TRINITY_DN3518_c0_g1_i4.p1 TRINITY_DN3518_c0_g1~~TRINITY_DN3518_c0_g1_i4.p1  ORF type:complete len:799 (+),score=88.53 TRINITY_DN3518_c0_g1_i4:182-2398(+)
MNRTFTEQLPNFDEECGRCRHFLENFLDLDNKAKYLEMLKDVADRKRKTLEISLEDLSTYAGRQGALQFDRNVLSNTLRYLKLFAEAADALMPHPSPEYAAPIDSFDTIMQNHMVEEQNRKDSNGNIVADNWSKEYKQIKTLGRRYDILLKTGEATKLMPLREVRAQHIGKTVRVKGIVTHVTDVKPLLSVAVYLDRVSGKVVFQEIMGKTFMPLSEVQNGEVRADLKMETKGCKFVKFQEARIQEDNEEVPEGATPRTLVVRFRGEITRKVKPGDAVVLTGIFLPEPNTGFKRLKAGLVTSTYLEVLDVEQQKKSYVGYNLTEQQKEDAQLISEDPDCFQRLATSLAPEIFGHVDVKKALLLAMVGGTTKKLSDGMKLRGDIHICLMGDPGVAKSQLLKHISRISPRAVYTTGKGSSGVGLMAAVNKDAMTGELVLEGGAVVLADRGICCIDEFDKMEEGDRTAIHEVMEQQTVSIAKAGITTTLNTRTTIVSAANPAYGRYDVNRSPEDNIAMPAALLSRFDLLWLILDKPSKDKDSELAQHVLTVHKTGKPPERVDENDPLTPEQLRDYISLAKKYEPILPDNMYEYVASRYVSLREQEQRQRKPSTYTTPRTLMSIMRLAQAHAKLRFSSVIQQMDVDEGLRLVRMSKASIDERRDGEGENEGETIYHCFEVMKQLLVVNQGKQVFTAAEVRGQCRNFSSDVIKKMLEEYSGLGVLNIEGNLENQQYNVYFLEE